MGYIPAVGERGERWRRKGVRTEKKGHREGEGEEKGKGREMGTEKRREALGARPKPYRTSATINLTCFGSREGRRRPRSCLRV